jgi:hypothetical protein
VRRLAPLVLLCLACVDINGGAVELAWALFGSGGRQCCNEDNPCLAAQVDEVWLRLQPISASGTASASLDFPFACNLNQSATNFVIPEGRYRITVDARNTQHPACLASGPAPIEREIHRGEVAELGALALTVPRCGCGDERNPCTQP